MKDSIGRGQKPILIRARQTTTHPYIAEIYQSGFCDGIMAVIDIIVEIPDVKTEAVISIVKAIKERYGIKDE